MIKKKKVFEKQEPGTKNPYQELFGQPGTKSRKPGAKTHTAL